MKNRVKNEKHRIAAGMLLFILLLLAVGAFMFLRMRQLLYNYMENQAAVQAEQLSQSIKDRFDTELADMNRLFPDARIAEDYSQSAFAANDALREEEPCTWGILTLDQRALLGNPLDFGSFTGIQDSFRGNPAVSYVPEQGLLFTVPVFYNDNVKYVYYRLYPPAALREEFLLPAFDGQADMALIDVGEQEIIPFEKREFAGIYDNKNTRLAYLALSDKLNVSRAAAVSCKEEEKRQFMFVAQIPDYSLYLVGFFPDEVMSSGLSSPMTLVIWVFALLILLMAMGTAYLFSAETRAMESDRLRMDKAIAENASKAKSDFLSSMSHEIRTPINAIIGMNEMVLRESGEENIHNYAWNIQSASRTLLSLINDVLDLSKIESGKMEIVPDAYQLASLIQDVVNMIQIKADQKHLDFNIEAAADLPRELYGDEVRNRQIIINLLNNAVKYTKEGSVSLTVSGQQEGTDTFLLSIAVSDTGIGIRKEDMDKLFGSFERLDIKKNRSVEGTGLGLSIAKQLAEAMAGTLSVQSQYGQGTTFTLLLPQKIVDSAPIGDFTKESLQTPGQQTVYKESFTAPDAKILVVDDNPMNLLVVEGLLKTTEIQISTAVCGGDALALMEKESFHMIMLDHMMPDMDGIELLGRAKNLAGNPCGLTPFIALTANAVKGAREMYLGAGFKDYLSKPIESARLEEMIKKYLPVEIIHPPSQENTPPSATKKVSAQPLPDRKTTAPAPGNLIDHDIAMQYCGDSEALYKKLLTVYCDSSGDKREKLQNYLRENNWNSYRVEIHSLKSSSLNIGCRILYESALALEAAAKEENWNYITQNHDSCMQLYQDVVTEGKAYLAL